MADEGELTEKEPVQIAIKKTIVRILEFTPNNEFKKLKKTSDDVVEELLYGNWYYVRYFTLIIKSTC